MGEKKTKKKRKSLSFSLKLVSVNSVSVSRGSRLEPPINFKRVKKNKQ